jgi:hypothetical protein
MFGGAGGGMFAPLPPGRACSLLRRGNPFVAVRTIPACARERAGRAPLGPREGCGGMPVPRGFQIFEEEDLK